RVAIDFDGRPTAKDHFDGVHWRTSADGRPWVATSSEGTGSSYWWPSKDSFWHPEDKPEHMVIDLAVPKGLIGVANGRLARRYDGARDLEHFLWVHDYPIVTYCVALNVAPYVEETQQITLDGIPDPVTFSYFVLPEHVERAKVEFAVVPQMLAIYGEAF